MSVIMAAMVMSMIVPSVFMSVFFVLRVIMFFMTMSFVAMAVFAVLMPGELMTFLLVSMIMMVGSVIVATMGIFFFSALLAMGMTMPFKLVFGMLWVIMVMRSVIMAGFVRCSMAAFRLPCFCFP